MKRIAIYCGSSKGKDEAYGKAAIQLAQLMIEKNIALVYGGSNIGIMGIIADEILKHHGQVIGVIPKRLMEKELAHLHLPELHVVENMHERKAMMMQLSDGFIAMPGGVGTLEEITEAFTWMQLGYHSKPCGLLNTNHYYDYLEKFFQHMVEQQFMKQMHKDLLLIENEPAILLEKILCCKPEYIDKWWKS